MFAKMKLEKEIRRILNVTDVNALERMFEDSVTNLKEDDSLVDIPYGLFYTFIRKKTNESFDPISGKLSTSKHYKIFIPLGFYCEYGVFREIKNMDRFKENLLNFKRSVIDQALKNLETTVKKSNMEKIRLVAYNYIMWRDYGKN